MEILSLGYLLGYLLVFINSYLSSPRGRRSEQAIDAVRKNKYVSATRECSRKLKQPTARFAPTVQTFFKYKTSIFIRKPCALATKMPLLIIKHLIYRGKQYTADSVKLRVREKIDEPCRALLSRCYSHDQLYRISFFSR